MSSLVSALFALPIVLSCGVLCAACAQVSVVAGTEALVEVDCDETLTPVLASVNIQVLDEAGEIPSSSREFSLKEFRPPFSFGVYQPERGADRFRVVASGMGTSGELLIQKTVVATFEPGQTIPVFIVLTEPCLLKFCDLDQTCWGGECSYVIPPDPPTEPTVVRFDGGVDAGTSAGTFDQCQLLSLCDGGTGAGGADAGTSEPSDICVRLAAACADGGPLARPAGSARVLRISGPLPMTPLE